MLDPCAFGRVLYVANERRRHLEAGRQIGAEEMACVDEPLSQVGAGD